MHSVLDLRIKVYNENLELWKNMATPQTSKKHTYFESFAFETKYEGTQVRVWKADTIDVGLNLVAKGLDPVLLNMSDINHPGGCVLAGAGMQEESLFRRSNYHKHLVSSFYPIGFDEVVYSPDVMVFRHSEEYQYLMMKEPKRFAFIACPGISMPSLTDSYRLHQEDETCLRTKIRTILQTAARHKHNAIVLGALGCGAFGCPPKHVAELFKDELNEVGGAFKEVHFAILGSNYTHFKNTFSSEPIT